MQPSIVKQPEPPKPNRSGHRTQRGKADGRANIYRRTSIMAFPEKRDYLNNKYLPDPL
ncbi:hypothetical protein [Pedobacter sp. Bi126]|uniref:hypothetical protein n=1 Tax=Pedobacter sp. Bi126 TaxID=2822349 RepID=UPI001E5E436B|nr:hypothetical protein [Pedobacter sp. Bi126]